MTTPNRQTTYATLAEAEADGWRKVDRKVDVDISGGNYFGYEYKAPDGQTSTTIILTQERNKFGMPGHIEMFRASNA